MFEGIDWGLTWAVTLSGITIVFLVLIFLIVVFTIFGKIMASADKKKLAKQEPEQAQGGTADSDEIAGVVSAAVNAYREDTAQLDAETAAVITAAITEYSGGKDFIIKEIEKRG